MRRRVAKKGAKIKGICLKIARVVQDENGYHQNESGVEKTSASTLVRFIALAAANSLFRM
jgi:hypothetical protein